MDNVPNLPLDFMTDVTSQTQLIHQPQFPNNKQNIYQLTTLEAEEYWTKKGAQSFYNKGMLVGGGESNPNMEVFFKKFKKLIEEIIRTELEQQNKTSEDFKDDFKILEHTYNNIIAKIKKNSTTPINIEKTLATLHGFINSFVGSTHA